MGQRWAEVGMSEALIRPGPGVPTSLVFPLKAARLGFRLPYKTSFKVICCCN